MISDLLLHPVEEISPLAAKPVQGSSRVSVAAPLASHLDISANFNSDLNKYEQ